MTKVSATSNPPAAAGMVPYSYGVYTCRHNIHKQNIEFLVDVILGICVFQMLPLPLWWPDCPYDRNPVVHSPAGCKVTLGNRVKSIFVENNHGCLTHCVSSSVVARSRHISRSNSSWRFEMTHGRLSKLNSISGLLACTWPLSKKFLDAHTVGNKAILPLCSVLMPHAWLGMNWGIHCSMECIRRSSKEAGMPGTQRPDWWSRGSGQHVFKSDPQ